MQYFWWGSVFLLAVPTMAMLLATGMFLLPDPPARGVGRPDPASLALSLVTPLAVVYGIKELAVHGPGVPSLSGLALGVAAGVVFGRRQRRSAEPFLDLGLFRTPAFAVAVSGMVLVGFLLLGTSLLTSQYLQLVLGYPPLQAGLWQLPTAVTGAAVAPAASGLADRIRPPVLMSAGAALAILGPVLLTQVDRNPAVLVAGSVLLFAGLTPFMALGTGAGLDAVPPERAGAASAVSETGAELGGALGIAVMGSVAAAVYAESIDGRMPDGVSAATAEAARQTLPAALSEAELLPDSLGTPLAEAARDAFA